MTRPKGMTEYPEGVRPHRVEPLWNRVDRNRVKFVVFVTLFILSIAAFFTGVVVAAIGLLALMTESVEVVQVWWENIGRIALVVAGASSVFGIVWVAWQLGKSERELLVRLGARLAPKGEYLTTKSALYDMTIAAGYDRPPRLYILDVPIRVNAFVLGRSYERSAIGVTQGFVDRLTPDQQRAVFANLMVRLRNLDTLWATAVSTLMGPIWWYRERQYANTPDLIPGDDERIQMAYARQMNHFWIWGWALLYFIVIVLTELLSYGHQKTAWMTGEKADAEGMLLLKDPRAMLDALEFVLGANNHVLLAGDAYSQLFYCWAGFGFAPEDDPEMRRIVRLREVLGAEGLAPKPRPNVPDDGLPPPAPRLRAGQDF